MNLQKQILVAPLNWGLGHATRCIPIINALIKHKYTPIIASDGIALSLLQKEFPELRHITLPAYNITYAKKGKHFKFKLIKDSPKLLKIIKREREFVKEFVSTETIHGIISDNRLGVYSKHIPSVFITHQINVLSGITTWLSSKMHQKVIKKFNECWIPDYQGTPNLSGKLGHSNTYNSSLKYIGLISRFKKASSLITYNLLVILSGPEPQRTLLENKLILLLKDYSGKVLLVRGVVENEVKTEINGSIKIINFLTSKELELAINSSELILSRSGYTTIMDLAKLGKKAFFIPTPGQFEQEYLAESLEAQRIIPFSTQDNFNLEELKRVDNYSGFTSFDFEINYKKLFSLFEGK